MRRLHALALVSALMVVLCTVPAQADPPAPNRSRIVTTTANIYTPLNRAAALHDVNLARNGSDVVLFQEMGPRPAKWYRDETWGAWKRPFSTCHELMTMWRRDRFKLISGTARIVTAYPTGGPHNVRCASRVILEERATGARYAFVNLHLIPHIEWQGHPRWNLPRRVENAKRNVSGVEQMAHAVDLPTIMGGDWNINCYADAEVKAAVFPYANLRDTMRPACIGRGTLGFRHVDTLWYRGCKIVRGRTIVGTKSDHNFSRVTSDCRRVIPEE